MWEGPSQTTYTCFSLTIHPIKLANHESYLESLGSAFWVSLLKDRTPTESSRDRTWLKTKWSTMLKLKADLWRVDTKDDMNHRIAMDRIGCCFSQSWVNRLTFGRMGSSMWAKSPWRCRNRVDLVFVVKTSYLSGCDLMTLNDVMNLAILDAVCGRFGIGKWLEVSLPGHGLVQVHV